MNNKRAVHAFLLGFFLSACLSPAQVVEVDTTHPTNHFVPRETLGAGVDRIAVEAIDKDLLQPTLQQTLASGWQPVTYRQNTELAIEAWHWNPQGTWSDPKGKGYFTGSANPTEMIRYSYGYALPRRGFTRNDGTENTGFSRLDDGDLEHFLEEQSISHTKVHRGERRVASAMGGDGFGAGATSQQHSHRLGRAFCAAL